MGMLFGGWTKEEEDEVNEYFGGDWNVYKQHQVAIREEQNKAPSKNDGSIPHLGPGEIIGKIDKETKQVQHMFLIDSIKDKKIFGTYISEYGDGQVQVYTEEAYSKLVSSLYEKI